MTDGPAADAASPHTAPRRSEVIGLGLIGSSIALRLRREGWFVTGNDVNADRMERARELGIIDAVGSDPTASIVFIATPAADVVDIARRILDDAQRNPLIVTDVAGVKTQIVEDLDDARFIGGHPMAGSEQEGPDGADADLFNGATWVLTPNAQTDPGIFARLREVVMSLGADPLSLGARRHDELVAVVSHLPHLTAANLMVVAASATGEQRALLRLAAGGFRDMTRVAAGDPAIWPDIFRDNRESVLIALDSLLAKLTEARTIVATGDRDALVSLLEEAKHARRNLPARVPLPEEMVECRVPVPDRPGVLAEITTVLGELGVNIWDLEIAHSAEGDRGVLVMAITAQESERAREALIARGYHPAIGRLG